MKNKTLLILTLFTFVSILSSCKSSVTPEAKDDPKDPRTKVPTLIGKELRLIKIERKNLPDYLVPPNEYEMVLTIDRLNRIRGETNCYIFLANVSWSASGNFIVNGITKEEKSNPRCVRRPVFELSTAIEYNYTIIEDYLFIAEPDEKAVAIFLPSEDNL